jgi:crotonobetainyl-CoA:carnitine CoA-transferase CaiB-like acyl-CoA transferase
MLELRSPEGTSALHELLDHADVVVCGYRPGALDRFGLTEDALATRHPGLVVVYLDAWGHRGPWQHRRGFDSVVQGPTGIAAGESTDGDRPGSLPCQLLDHGTGYLSAAAVLDGLHRQSMRGGTHIRRLSLARTAAWLTESLGAGARSAFAENGSPPVPASSPSEPRWLVEVDSADGPVTAVAPPGMLDDRPLHWPSRLHRYGNDPPTWSL